MNDFINIMEKNTCNLVKNMIYLPIIKKRRKVNELS